LKKNFTNKIGILGGTFDPAHMGHLKISIEAKKRYELKKIIWVLRIGYLTASKDYLNQERFNEKI